MTTDDPHLDARIRMLRDHGQESKYHHRVIGWNQRLDGIQAAVLSVKLRHLPEWNEARRANAERYRQRLQGLPGVVPPTEAERRRHAWHVYAVEVPERDALLAALKEEGVACGIHYPVPIHLQPAYAGLGLEPGAFPVSERGARSLLSLPMYAELSPGQLDHVAAQLEAALSRRPSSERSPSTVR